MKKDEQILLSILEELQLSNRRLNKILLILSKLQGPHSRTRSKIAKDRKIRNLVKKLVLNEGYTYTEITNELKKRGFPTSRSAVGRLCKMIVKQTLETKSW